MRGGSRPDGPVLELPRPVALVLSGGASLGAIQVGMIASLQRFGIRPDLVVGTSVGSLNGAMVASGPDLAVPRLRRLWSVARRSDIFPMHPRSLIGAALGRSRHLVPPDGLARLLARSLAVGTFAECELPFTAIATEELTGHRAELDTGDLAPALLASSAIPGVFPPVVIDGRALVDGGLTSNVPIGVAVARGAASVIVADAAAPCHLTRPPRTIPEILVHSLGTLTRLQVAAEIELARGKAAIIYLPTPCTARRSPLEFTGAEQLMAAAEALSDQLLAEIAAAGPVPVGLCGTPHRHDTAG